MLSCKGTCKTKFGPLLGKTILHYMNGQKRCGIWGFT